MKIIRIKGGLGNQMFQYAFGRKLMTINKENILFDTSFFESYKSTEFTPRNFLLENFNISSKIKFKLLPENTYFMFIRRILKKIGFNLEEYFQNEKYFIEIEDIIRNEFTLKNRFSKNAEKISLNIKNKLNSVSLHVRRGDYVLNNMVNSKHGTCNLDYYGKAIKYIKEKVDSPVFFIFSDDIAWVRENLKIESSFYVSSSEIKDYEELILMSYCKHNVIANSTFSWWGAWLNPNKNKIVIAPEHWTVKKTSNQLQILPKYWVQI